MRNRKKCHLCGKWMREDHLGWHMEVFHNARTALNQETGSFTDDPFNRAVLGLPLKEPGQ